MDINESVLTVQKSPEFKDFKQKNPEYYLASVFSLKGQWVVGYYSKKKDRMVTFDVKPVKQNPADEVFKKEEIVEPLDLEKVKVSEHDADKKVNDLLKHKYKGHAISQKIIILQNHEKHIYNITLITSTFNVINIKIDAADGNLLHDSITAALSFKQK